MVTLDVGLLFTAVVKALALVAVLDIIGVLGIPAVVDMLEVVVVTIVEVPTVYMVLGGALVGPKLMALVMIVVATLLVELITFVELAVTVVIAAQEGSPWAMTTLSNTM